MDDKVRRTKQHVCEIYRALGGEGKGSSFNEIRKLEERRREEERRRKEKRENKVR